MSNRLAQAINAFPARYVALTDFATMAKRLRGLSIAANTKTIGDAFDSGAVIPCSWSRKRQEYVRTPAPAPAPAHPKALGTRRDLR